MKKYDSIPRYGKQGTRDILGTEVVVMEKLDGANASFGIIDGELKMFSRNQELDEHNTLRGFYDWVRHNVDPRKLFVSTIYFGEWLVPHTVQYKKEVQCEFYLFDIYDVKTDTYLDWNITVQAAKHLGLRTPEVFFRGELHSMTDVDKYLGQSDTNDYSYRDKENMWICDITDALEDPTRFVVQENTGVEDIFGRYIFEGDNVSFNETIFSKTTVLTGTVSRSESGTWVIMHDKDIPFYLYNSKTLTILGHINEGV